MFITSIMRIIKRADFAVCSRWWSSLYRGRSRRWWTSTVGRSSIGSTASCWRVRSTTYRCRAVWPINSMCQPLTTRSSTTSAIKCVSRLAV